MLIKNGFMKNKNRIALIIPYFTSTPRLVGAEFLHLRKAA